MPRKSWLHQIVTIENKGYAAFESGALLTANPYMAGYHNQNGPGGAVQRQRRMAWIRGWENAKLDANDKIEKE